MLPDAVWWPFIWRQLCDAIHTRSCRWITQPMAKTPRRTARISLPARRPTRSEAAESLSLPINSLLRGTPWATATVVFGQKHTSTKWCLLQSTILWSECLASHLSWLQNFGSVLWCLSSVSEARFKSISPFFSSPLSLYRAATAICDRALLAVFHLLPEQKI